MGIWSTIAGHGRKAANAAAALGTFDVSVVTDAPAERVWDIFTDTRTWSHWGPSVRHVELESERLTEGARGRIETAGGLWIDFEITEWDPGRRWVWEVGGVRATGHRVESLDDGRTRLVFEVPIVAAPYAAICRRAAKKIVEMARR